MEYFEAVVCSKIPFTKISLTKVVDLMRGGKHKLPSGRRNILVLSNLMTETSLCQLLILHPLSETHNFLLIVTSGLGLCSSLHVKSNICQDI